MDGSLAERREHRRAGMISEYNTISIEIYPTDRRRLASERCGTPTPGGCIVNEVRGLCLRRLKPLRQSFVCWVNRLGGLSHCLSVFGKVSATSENPRVPQSRVEIV